MTTASQSKESFWQEVEGFFSGVPVHVRTALIGLGHIAPLLTQAAVVAETVTGNVALIPMTDAAGSALAGLAASANAGDTAATVKAVVQGVEQVAQSSGASSVAATAAKVESALNGVETVVKAEPVPTDNQAVKLG